MKDSSVHTKSQITKKIQMSYIKIYKYLLNQAFFLISSSVSYQITKERSHKEKDIRK